MKQKCTCGNWVEGHLVADFARKLTRGAVKKGSSMAVGAAIGSVVPGIGTVVGGVAGLVAGALMDDHVKKVSDGVEDVLFDNDSAEYEFICPKCGRKWTEHGTNGTSAAMQSGNKQTKNQQSERSKKRNDKRKNDNHSTPRQSNSQLLYSTSYNEDVVDESMGIEEFEEVYNWCINNIDDACENFNDLVEKCVDNMETASNTVRSQYYFLLAWVKWLCLYGNSFMDKTNESIDIDSIEEGKKYIRFANEIYDSEDAEYALFKNIYDLWDMDFDDGWDLISSFDEEEDISNSILNKDFLINIWKYNAFKYIWHKFEHYEDDDEYDEYDEEEYYALRNERINVILDFFDQGDYLEEDDHYLILVNYLFGKLSYALATGQGCECNPEQAFELAEKAAERGNFGALYRLGVLYSGYEDFEPNIPLSIECLEAVIKGTNEEDEVHGLAQERLSKINDNNECKDCSSDTAQEQEYIDMLKDILEDGEVSARERKLLEKLRVKLGISEDRAKELEDSLSQPQLSEEEIEYLNEYRDIIADGEITPRERKLLDKICKMNGISPERAKELEAMA